MDIDRSKGQWFIVHTLSGKENKVREKIESQIRLADASIPVYEVLIPTEKVTEIKNGKKKTNNRKIFPGYVYIRMDLYDENGELNEKAWSFVQGVQGVISFIGSYYMENGAPRVNPLSTAEVEDLMRQTEEVAENAPAVAKIPSYISIGATVRITDGPFSNFEGVIEEIDAERGKLKLMVSIFGRSTPVEQEFWQVGPDED